MTDEVEQAAVIPLNAQGCVEVDQPCMTCGYNLRMLSAELRCPECGTPVSFSLGGYLLSNADPVWVRRVARGLALLLLMIALTVLFTAGIIAVAFATFAPFNPTTIPDQMPAYMSQVTWIALPVNLLLGALATLGLLALSSPNPAEVNVHPETLPGRQFVRVCAWAVLATYVIGVVQSLCWWLFIGTPDINASLQLLSRPWFWLVLLWGYIAAAIQFLVTPCAVMSYIGTLMHRIPRPGLRRLARIAFWGYLITIGIAGAGNLMTQANSPYLRAGATSTIAAPAGASSSSTQPAAVEDVSDADQPPTTTSATADANSPATQPTAPTAVGIYGGPINSGMMIGSGLTICGGCPGAGFAIAGLVLLIMAYGAISAAAKAGDAGVTGDTAGTEPRAPE